MSDTIRGLRELLRVLDTPSVLCVCDLAEKPCPRCLRLINAMTKICQNVPALLDIAESAEEVDDAINDYISDDLCRALNKLREAQRRLSDKRN